MGKPTLLYASPFPPMKSGISDYSVILVKALATKFDITLFIDNYDIDEPSLKDFPVVKYGQEIDFDKYDHILYNMGNDCTFHKYIYDTALSHPGVIIEHDLVLFHFMMGYLNQNNTLYSSLYSKFGIDTYTAIRNAIEDQNVSVDLASGIALNDELLKSGNRFIVHSEYTRNKILETGFISEDKITKVNLIEQIADNEKFIDKTALYKKFNVDPEALLVVSLGNIIETKKNIETARVIKRIAKKTDRRIYYLMVGKGDFADEELEEGLVGKTGYTELDEFNSFAAYADIIVNLRYPSFGETSGAILRCLQLGKPIVTNDGGWFTELSSDIVVKIELDNLEKNLENALLKLIEDEESRKTYGANAMDFVQKECSKSVIAEKMYNFITAK